MSFKSRRASTKFDDPSELRSATLRKKNLSSIQGVDNMENMDLEVNLNPRDGVTCYKLAAGQDVMNMSGGTAKFQVSKKGKPYAKMSKDNKTRRMTKVNYEDLTENASLRQMRQDYDKMTATMRETDLEHTFNMGKSGKFNINDQSEISQTDSQASSR